MTASVWPRRLMTGLYLFLAPEFTLGAVTKPRRVGRKPRRTCPPGITGALALANWPKD